MASDDKTHDQFLKRLVSTISCGVCGQHYEATNISILGHQNDLWFLGVYCPSCKSHGLVAAVVREGKLPEIITDLSERELAEFESGETVGADDVLDVHNFLKGFDGDFSRIFSNKKRS